MSSVNIGRVNTGNQITSDYDLSKIFLFNNRYEADNYVNNYTYGSLNLLAGTVMGRIASTGSLVPCDASAVDGSQFPIGILAHDLLNLQSGEVRAGVTICISGDIAAEKLIFITGNTLDTVVNGRRFRDRIQSDSVGLLLRTVTDMTDFDN